MKKCGYSTKKTSCLLGAHFSILKGLHNALYEAQAYGCNALQIFTKNSNTWKERTLSQDEIDCFDRARKVTGITAIASHTSYLINLQPMKRKSMPCHAMPSKMSLSDLQCSASRLWFFTPELTWKRVKTREFGESQKA